MADLSILIAQEAARLSEQLILPTRIYFPSGTFAADVTVTPDAGWNNTASAALRKAVTDGRKRGTAAASVTITGTAANPEKMLHAQYITKPLLAQTIAGNIRGQFRCLESATGANATIQIGIRVVSKNGATVRATLLAVGGTTTTSTTPPEFASSLTNRRLLTSGDVTPLPLTSYTCTDGDRLVIEIGHNNKSVSTSQTHGISFGDNTVDLTTDDTATAAQDPWIEFDSTVAFSDQVDIVRISDGGTTQLQNTGWIRANDRDEIAVVLSGIATALFHQENLKIGESLTVVRDLGVIVSDETLHCAEVLPPSALIADPGLSAPLLTENVHVVDTVTNRTLDPLQASPSETLKLADPTPTILPIGQITAGPENVRIIDSGFGLTSLIGVIHIQDSISAAIGAGIDLSVSLNPGETLKLADTLTASRDLTVSGIDESLKLADSVTADEDRWTLVTAEALRIAEPTLLRQLDPLLATPSESLKISDPASGQVLQDLSATPASEDPIHVVDGPPVGRLDPIQVLTGSDSLKISDAASGQLTPLQFTALTETVKIGDSILAQFPIEASKTETLKLAETVNARLDLIASVQESLKLSDAVGALMPNLSVNVSETLKLADRVIILAASVFEGLKLQDTGRGATSLIGVIHITDTVQAQIGTGISAGLTETLHLSDPLGVERSPFEATAQEILKLGYALSQVEFVRDEYFTIRESLSVDLSATGTLTTSIQEPLKLADAASMNRDLEGLVTADALKLADTPAASRTIEATVTSDSLKLADAVTVSRDLTATPTESARLSESAAGQEDPEEGLTADSLKVVDNVFASLGNPSDLTVGQADDVLYVIEQLVVARDLTVTLSEALRIGEVFDAGDGSLLRGVASELLILSDVSITNTDIRIGLEQDDLSIVDTVEASLATPLAIESEVLRLSDVDLAVGLDLATDTTNDADRLGEPISCTLRAETTIKTVRHSPIRTVRREIG